MAHCPFLTQANVPHPAVAVASRNSLPALTTYLITAQKEHSLGCDEASWWKPWEICGSSRTNKIRRGQRLASYDWTKKLILSQCHDWTQFSSPSSQNYVPVVEAEHPQQGSAKQYSYAINYLLWWKRHKIEFTRVTLSERSRHKAMHVCEIACSMHPNSVQSKCQSVAWCKKRWPYILLPM